MKTIKVLLHQLSKLSVFVLVFPYTFHFAYGVVLYNFLFSYIQHDFAQYALYVFHNKSYDIVLTLLLTF